LILILRSRDCFAQRRKEKKIIENIIFYWLVRAIKVNITGEMSIKNLAPLREGVLILVLRSRDCFAQRRKGAKAQRKEDNRKNIIFYWLVRAIKVNITGEMSIKNLASLRLCARVF